MNYVLNPIYTEEQFEEIQKDFNGKAEFSHNRIKGKILSKLNLFLSNTKCEPFDEQIEVIFQDDEELYKFKPDVFVVCEGYTTKGESITSAPLIIFEIVSKSTASHDYISKMYVYQKFKVQEYNIVEPSGKIVQYVLGDDNQYHIHEVYKNTDIFKSTIFDEFSLELKDIF
ncbi:MAG: Uma2 family endonuclease [Paraclostridium sp.]